MLALAEAFPRNYRLKPWRVGQSPLDLEHCQDEVDHAQSWVSQEEQNDVCSFGVDEAIAKKKRREDGKQIFNKISSPQVCDKGSASRLARSDHDDNKQEEQDLCLPHVKLTHFLKINSDTIEIKQFLQGLGQRGSRRRDGSA